MKLTHQTGSRYNQLIISVIAKYVLQVLTLIVCYVVQGSLFDIIQHINEMTILQMYIRFSTRRVHKLIDRES